MFPPSLQYQAASSQARLKSCWALSLVQNPPPPFLLFSLVRETWSTRAAALQITEAYRIEHCPDCHLAQISFRKGAGAQVLHCDGSLKGLAIPRIWEKMLSKLLSTTAAFVLYILQRWALPRWNFDILIAIGLSNSYWNIGLTCLSNYNYQTIYIGLPIVR